MVVSDHHDFLGLQINFDLLNNTENSANGLSNKITLIETAEFFLFRAE